MGNSDVIDRFNAIDEVYKLIRKLALSKEEWENYNNFNKKEEEIIDNKTNEEIISDLLVKILTTNKNIYKCKAVQYGYRYCNVCKTLKLLKEFQKGHHYCKECHNLRRRKCRKD